MDLLDRKKVLFLVLSIIAFSCKQILDEDVEQLTPRLLAPADGVESDKLSQTFWWEEMDGVDGYRIQIVEGDFTNITELVLDSLIETGTTFKYSLRPGQYTWRIRGENSNYKSKFASRRLIISDSSDLSGQELLLISPSVGKFLSFASVLFTWSNIPLQDVSYQVRIKDSLDVLIKDTTVVSPSLTVSLTEHKYIWHVEASNNGPVKLVSENGMFYVDLTPPGAAVIAPAEETASGMRLSWSAADNFGIDKYLITVYHPDSGTVFKEYNRLTVNNSQVIVPDTTGNFWWFVESMDKAGNLSEKSDIGTYNR